MRYLLLIYGNPARFEHPLYLRDPAFLALPEAERDAVTRQAGALLEEITESGELVTGGALAGPEEARTVRVRDGVPAATDGPYLEAKEHLAGYFLLECASAERADAIAARFPDARFGAVELRPVVG
jgi:hypothetical protein